MDETQGLHLTYRMTDGTLLFVKLVGKGGQSHDYLLAHLWDDWWVPHWQTTLFKDGYHSYHFRN